MAQHEGERGMLPQCRHPLLKGETQRKRRAISMVMDDAV
jgi:hypothetical protein